MFPMRVKNQTVEYKSSPSNAAKKSNSENQKNNTATPTKESMNEISETLPTTKESTKTPETQL